MNRPWMPLHIGDYLRDTRHLDGTEHGAYLLLIMHYWTADGELPDDDKQLARIVCLPERRWKACRPIIQKFFHNGWKHKRIDTELAAARAKHDRRVDAGKRGGIASAESKQNPSNAGSNAQATYNLDTKKEEREEPADAGSSSDNRFAFESGIIRLSEKNLNQWKASYSYLDVPGELLALSEWAEQQGKRWFPAVSALLGKRNREAKIATEREKKQPFKWNGIEGVI